MTTRSTGADVFALAVPERGANRATRRQCQKAKHPLRRWIDDQLVCVGCDTVLDTRGEG